MANVSYRTQADKAIDKCLEFEDAIKERKRKGASVIIDDLKADALQCEKEALENLRKAGIERMKKVQKAERGI